MAATLLSAAWTVHYCEKKKDVSHSTQNAGKHLTELYLCTGDFIIFHHEMDGGDVEAVCLFSLSL